MEAAESAKTGEAILRFFRQALSLALRAVLVLLVVVVAILVGIAIPVLCQDLIKALPPAGLTFGAAALLSVFRGLIESIPTAWDFILKSVADSLPRLFAQLSVAALGFGFAYFAVVAGSAPSRSLNLQVAGSLPSIVLDDNDSLFTAYVVFDDWNAKLTDESQVKLVDNLVDTLATCLQAKEDLVRVAIRAYASSHGPDNINEQLYKERATHIEELMNARVGQRWPGLSSQFKVEVRNWKSLRIMELRRLFKDTGDDGIYLPQAGALNRRAEIKVEAAGACLPN